MHEDPHAFRPIDPGRVNAMDPVEFAWWAREFGCSETELLEIVAAVGEHVTEIRVHLEWRRGTGR